jgi:hypothetical protein
MEATERHLKTPWPVAALPLAGALFGVYGTIYAAAGQDPRAALFFFGGSVGMLAIARLAASPRLDVKPDALVYPRGWITMKPILIPWSEIESADFELVSGFAWPMLMVRVRGREKPLGIPFPLVNLNRRREALELIQKYLREAQGQ